MMQSPLDKIPIADVMNSDPSHSAPLRDASEGGPGSLVAFPARERGRPPNNLPLALSSFVGREKELAGARLLTLNGSGGCGKTSLALAVASDVAEDFEDGVWLVELASLSDPELVPQAVTSTLGVPEQPGRSLTKTLSDHLRTRKVLLVLDNCEHLIETCAALAGTLLRACPRLRVLATSREALGIVGEVAWPLTIP